MRKHGKLAVLKDDEVDRIERKVRTATGAVTAHCTMPECEPPRCVQVASVEDMYGRANPKPIPPSYDAEDLRAMKAVEEREALAERTNVTGACWRVERPVTRHSALKHSGT